MIKKNSLERNQYLTEKKKIKIENMIVNDIRISQKILIKKNPGQSSVDKDIMK